MASGCEFTCKNKECKYTNAGFNLHSPWALVSIDEIINLLKKDTKKNRDKSIQTLEQMKIDGRTTSILPNQFVKENLPVLGHRIQLWSPHTKTIHNYDIESAEDLNNWKIPLCPDTGKDLMTFPEIIKNGIKCPHCNVEMKQNRWFTNG